MTKFKTYNKFMEEKLSRFFAHHPFGAYALLFLGVPSGILLGVTLFTGVFIYPMGLLMGWL